MRPVQHASSNGLLLPPPGATNEECRPLPVTRVTYANDVPGVWSYWEPTAQERAALAAGAKVCLMCMGTTHPPVIIAVEGIRHD